MANAADQCDDLQRRHRAMIEQLTAFAGPSAVRGGRQRDPAQDASEFLSHLRALGVRLREEHERQVRDTVRMRAEARNVRSGSAVGRRARTWAVVDTTQVAMRTTLDTDLIRALARLLPSSAGAACAGINSGPEGAYVRDPVTGQWVSEASATGISQATADLMHGGPQVAYARDPVTGHWATPGAARVVCAQAPTVAMGMGAERGPEGNFTRDPHTGRWVSSRF